MMIPGEVTDHMTMSNVKDLLIPREVTDLVTLNGVRDLRRGLTDH